MLHHLTARPSSSQTFAGRALALGLLDVVLLPLAGCEEKKPTKMEIRPAGPITFEDRAVHKKIHLAFFTEDGKPFVRKPTATFDAEDPSVVTVTAEPDGATATLVAKKTGTTKVNVKAFDLTGSIDVTSNIIGSIAFAPGLPKSLKMGKKLQAKAVVKNDRGEVIEGAPVTFSASDYCLSVDPDGKTEAVSLGACDIVVKTTGFSASHTIEVK